MNYYYGTYQSSVVDSLQSLWFKVLSFLPNLLAAIIFLILGWLVAVFLSRLIKKVLEALLKAPDKVMFPKGDNR